MGKESAIRAAGHLQRCGVQKILSFGTAAALCPHLESGQLLVPKAFLLPSGETLSANFDLWQEVMTCLSTLQPHTGPLLATEEIVATSQKKSALFEKTDMKALDMESGFLAAWARERSLAFAAVRVVVDRADMALPPSLLKALDREGKVRLRLLVSALFSPSDLMALVQLAIAFHQARKALAAAATLLSVDLPSLCG